MGSAMLLAAVNRDAPVGGAAARHRRRRGPSAGWCSPRQSGDVRLGWIAAAVGSPDSRSSGASRERSSASRQLSTRPRRRHPMCAMRCAPRASGW
jgi:hypothetical protein